MRFQARTISANNVIRWISIDAPSREEVLRHFERENLHVLDIRPAKGWIPRGGTKFELLLFCQELYALLSAGLTLLEALQGLAEKEGGVAPRALLLRLITLLQEGNSFSAALQAHTDHFPQLFIGLIQAAETTGNIAAALVRYIEYQQRVNGVREKVISAAIYPAILLVVGMLVTGFLGGYVVPKFAVIYKDSGRDLPAMSLVLLHWGQFAAAHTQALLWTGLAIAASSTVGLLHLQRSGALSRWVRLLPAIGPWLRLYELSRLYLTLGMLLESGISVIQSLTMSEAVVSAPVKLQIQRAKEQIMGGEAFSDTLARHQLTTSISFRMLRVGERSGQLDSMLLQAAAFYDGTIARFVERFTRALEPILMTVIGIIVGGIVVLLYLPIFDMASTLQ